MVAFRHYWLARLRKEHEGPPDPCELLYELHTWTVCEPDVRFGEPDELGPPKTLGDHRYELA
ncbi:hypothetical protein [Mumia zhuanghuii]|uniref:Uncharacterized protein n=1 Tax=Mumia zhuanghuii TaxID=2585211 RepID=A0A5C4MCG2_9ACTN|nr:hypothetical protein [Mumia zhuanghuii]TNC35592.1 hypothetical protein FHE65_26965 [Mumia zhuanghuii]